MASVVPEQADWSTKFNQEVKASDKESILAWYDKAKDPVKNPSYLIGLDDEGKKLFEYIIEGIILSLEDGPGKAAKVKNIVDKLKKYYLSLPQSESDNELVIIDLLVKVSEDVPNLKLKKAFSLPDFQYHIPEGWLNSVDFFEFCGLTKEQSQEQSQDQSQSSAFLTKIKAVLAPKKIQELENLADIYEEDTLNLRYKFKYNLKKAAMVNSILLSIVEHLIEHGDDYDMETRLNKIAKVKLSILYIYDEFYTTINSSGLSPPIGLFRDFFNMLKEPNNDELLILYWYFKKLERIFEHTAVSEIKTQEALYDLFDLIEVENIYVSESGLATIAPAQAPGANEVMRDQSQSPLRTIHFRKDFKVSITDTITIEEVQIPPAFWLSIDKNICLPRNLPFSYFHGALSEQVMLRPLCAMLIDETKMLQRNEATEPIFAVIDDIAAATATERCIPRTTKEMLLKNIYSGVENDGYELNEEQASELPISILLQMSAINLVYAANVKASFITKADAANKLENVAYVYLNYAINKAINTNAYKNTVKENLSSKSDPTGTNAATFITTAYYNYFNNEIKYTIDVNDPFANLLGLLTQIPSLA
jgi:hypothetical protein